MDSFKAFLQNLILDICDYLQYIEDYGKPNYKYFNFVLNKLGLMHVFLYKSIIFNGKNYNIIKFVENTLQSLKKKFIDEESNLKRAGLIFLISKIYFTDEIATNLKLRIIHEEWEVFKDFIRSVKDDSEYLHICLMFYHLYTENFFRFTLKTNMVGLDFGVEQNSCDNFDSTSTTTFWSGVENEIKKLDHVNVKELKQLCEIREEVVVKPFDKILPEVVPTEEIFEEFSEIKTAVEKLKQSDASVSRKKVRQACRDYMKTSASSSASTSTRISLKKIGISDDEIDLESLEMSLLKSSKRKSGKEKSQKKKSKNFTDISAISMALFNTIEFTTSESD